MQDFNNIAIAVTQALNDFDRIVIFDIDAHHGNGTQDIFAGSASEKQSFSMHGKNNVFPNDRVMYISIHQHPCYPYTGLQSSGNAVNMPIPLGTTGPEYIRIFNELIERAKHFNPDMVAVSAGFDTYKDDPLTDLRLKLTDYKKIAQMIKELDKPCFAVLEGGYHQSLGECIFSFVSPFH
ncbi:MAG: hypothetical protein HZB66_02090 [Candidatus Aenigmarchaeota archaeon]|nr:hypothetical protein [Candidatus Aenigmarchaeota archaeon]